MIFIVCSEWTLLLTGFHTRVSRSSHQQGQAGPLPLDLCWPLTVFHPQNAMEAALSDFQLQKGTAGFASWAPKLPCYKEARAGRLDGQRPPILDAS